MLNILQEAKRDLGEILSAFEFLDHECLRSVAENLGLQNPLMEYPFYCMIETSGSNGDHDEEKLNNFLEQSMENGNILNGTIATSASKMKVEYPSMACAATSLLTPS